MKLLATLLVVAFLFTSCSSTKKTTGPVASPAAATSKTVSSSGDGSDYDKAIVIDKKNESAGVAEEYKWLREHYPGYTLIKQSLKHKDGKSYDVMNIKTKEGEEKNIYFDITNFFGKF